MDSLGAWWNRACGSRGQSPAERPARRQTLGLVSGFCVAPRPIELRWFYLTSNRHADCQIHQRE